MCFVCQELKNSWEQGLSFTANLTWCAWSFQFDKQIKVFSLILVCCFGFFPWHILFFNLFTTFIFSLQNSMEEEPAGSTGGKYLGHGRSVVDSLGQLNPCLVLLGNCPYFLVFLSLASSYQWSKNVKTALLSLGKGHWKSAFGLGFGPKVLTESLRLIVTQPSRVLHWSLRSRKTYIGSAEKICPPL